MVMFGSPNTSLFLGWQRNANALLQVGLEGVSDYFDLHDSGTALSRLAVLAVFSGAGYVVNQAFSLTAHDARHMDTARAIGATGVSLVRISNGREMSIWEFFWAAFDFTSEPGLYTYSLNNPSPTDVATIAAAGLDTNMLIADMIGRKMDGGAGHITDLAPYLLNKLWGIGYLQETGPTSDAGDFVSALNAQGYSAVTRGTILSLHAMSFFLSGGFLGLMRGTYDFVFQGESTVKPLGLTVGDMRIFWPELTTWLNPDNVSLQISADAAWRDGVFVQAGIDTPILGNTSSNPEVTFGVTVKIPWLSLGTELTSHFSRFPFLKGSLELDLGETFSIGVEGYYGEGNTMRERREYPLGPGAVGFVMLRF
jgi:hypothetical protein